MKLRRRAATALDEVARVAGRLADLLDPPRPILERAIASEQARSRARHPSTTGVVPDDPPSYASGRADLQLVHDAAARDLTTRARKLGDRARDDWNRLVENSWHDTGPQGEA